MVVDGRFERFGRKGTFGRGYGDQLAVEVGQVSGENLSILGMQTCRNDHAAAAGRVHGHDGGLGRGGTAVVETRVRHVHAGQLRDERLVFEQRLQVPLAGLGLVGRVGRIELAPRGDRIDHGRDEVIVAAAAQEAGPLSCRRVLGSQPANMGREFQLTHRRRQVKIATKPQFVRHHIKQLVERPDADRFEHSLLIVGSVRDIGHGKVGARRRKKSASVKLAAEGEVEDYLDVPDLAKAGELASILRMASRS